MTHKSELNMILNGGDDAVLEEARRTRNPMPWLEEQLRLARLWEERAQLDSRRRMHAARREMLELTLERLREYRNHLCPITEKVVGISPNQSAELTDKIMNCTAGDIVTAANVINELRFTNADLISAESIARRTLVAALFVDGWSLGLNR